MRLTGDPAISKEHAKIVLSKKEEKPVPIIIDLEVKMALL